MNSDSVTFHSVRFPFLNQPIRIVTLTQQGKTLGQRIQTLLSSRDAFAMPVSLWYQPKPFASALQQAFQAGEGLICICAAGIVVRTLAPVLTNKHDDPPVLVLDEQGRFVIPLLSGHEGGGNWWGNQLASALDAELVITTAGQYLDADV